MIGRTSVLVLASWLVGCGDGAGSRVTFDLSELRARAALGGITLDRLEIHVEADSSAEPIIVALDPSTDVFELDLAPGVATFSLVAERALTDLGQVPAFVGRTTVTLVSGDNDVVLGARPVGLVRGTTTVSDSTPVPGDFEVAVATASPIEGITPASPALAPGGTFELVLGVADHDFTAGFESGGTPYEQVGDTTYAVTHGEVTTVELMLVAAGTKCDATQATPFYEAAPACHGMQVQATGVMSPGMVARLSSPALSAPRDLAIDGDGLVAFDTGLPEGATYDVTLATEPADVDCTLGASSSGTVGAGDVSVSLMCVPAPYTISIDGRGITEPTTVTLSSPASATVQLTTDGITLLAGGLAQGSDYLAQVTQPLDPARHCYLNQAEGTVTGNLTLVLVCLGEVEPTFPDLPAWNDWIDSAATPVVPCPYGGPFDTCLHSGELRTVVVPDVVSCAGTTAYDLLGAFDWECDDSQVPTVWRSTGLTGGAGLTDLVSFAAKGFAPNAVVVTDGNGVLRQTPSSVWWSNPVIEMVGSDLPLIAGIWLVTANTAPLAAITPLDGTAIIVSPAVGLYAPPLGQPAVSIPIGRDIWIEGGFTSGPSSGPTLDLNQVQSAVLRGVTVEAPQDGGVGLNASMFCRVEGLHVTGAASAAVSFEGLSQSRISDVFVEGSNGSVDLYGDDNLVRRVRVLGDTRGLGSPAMQVSGTGNRLYDLRFANMTSGALTIGAGAYDTVVNQVRVSNVGSHGIELGGSINTRVVDALVVNTGLEGVHMNAGSNAVVANVTVGNVGSAYYGLAFGGVSDTTIMNVISTNDTVGMGVGNGTNVTVHNLASLACDMGLFTSYNVRFLDRLVMGGNSTMCSTDNVAMYNATCSAEGTEGSSTYPDQSPLPSSTAILSVDQDAATAFVGYVITDAANPSDLNCVATCNDSLDWLSFDNPFRAYTLHATWPTAGHRGRITPGTECCIFDWRLSDSGDLTSIAADPQSLSLVSRRAGSGASSGDCADHFPGTTYDGSGQCLEAYLPSAVELFGDGVGNDDVLCNVGDRCVISQNLGAYQGQGALVLETTLAIGGGSIDLYRFSDTVSAGSVFELPP